MFKNYLKLVLPFLFASLGLLGETKIIPPEQTALLKKQVLPLVASRERAIQEMVDSIFSFGELGFQEVETSKDLTDWFARRVSNPRPLPCQGSALPLSYVRKLNLILNAT